jgi:hypothetical protein
LRRLETAKGSLLRVRMLRLVTCFFRLAEQP